MSARICLDECACVQVALCVSLSQNMCACGGHRLTCVSFSITFHILYLKTGSHPEPGHTDLSKLAGQ